MNEVIPRNEVRRHQIGFIESPFFAKVKVERALNDPSSMRGLMELIRENGISLDDSQLEYHKRRVIEKIDRGGWFLITDKPFKPLSNIELDKHYGFRFAVLSSKNDRSIASSANCVKSDSNLWRGKTIGRFLEALGIGAQLRRTSFMSWKGIESMRHLKPSAETLFIGWGLFDAIYIVRYAFLSLSAGRIPYLDDFNSGVQLLAEHGALPKVLAVLVWGLEISIVVSCFLFFLRWRAARWLAYFQVPFRLMFLVPSVSVLFMGPDLKERYGIALLLVLLVLSECLKVWTLWVSRRGHGGD